MVVPEDRIESRPFGDEWSMLANALADPVLQLVAIEARDPAQMGEIERRLADLAGSRPLLWQPVPWGPEAAEDLWRSARDLVGLAGDPTDADADAAAIPLLIVTVGAWSGDPDERARLAAFWRGMNQLRERWHDLPAQVVFLLSPLAYEHLSLNADHLKRWIAVKVHPGAEPLDAHALRRPGTALGRSAAAEREAERVLAARRERLRKSLALLARQARAGEDRGEGPAELARRYYLPLAAGFLALGDPQRAGAWRRRVGDPARLDPQDLAGLSRLDERLLDAQLGLDQDSVQVSVAGSAGLQPARAGRPHAQARDGTRDQGPQRRPGGADSAQTGFDVFLSHNSRDKPAARALAQALRERDLSVWLDEEQLRPGLPWQTLLEAGVRAARSIAVLIGADGLGPWEDEEIYTALALAARDGRPVIPVLLPDAPGAPALPPLLADRTWVDLRPKAASAPGRDGSPIDRDALDRLVWGIAGRHPNR